jgi:hypothetical protein
VALALTDEAFFRFLKIDLPEVESSQPNSAYISDDD